jgi:renalase
VRVGVIGAGLSGLGAARTLADAGHDVAVFEKSRGVGGRLAARRVDGTVVDHGAPVIEVPAGSALGALVDALGADDLVELGSPAGVRLAAYRSGATRLAKLMSADLAVTTGVRISALRAAGDRFELAGEQGNTHGIVDAVIVSAPAPQAADLLDASPEPPGRAERLRAVRYDPAVMVLAGLLDVEAEGLDLPAPPPPFLRVTIESRKGRPAPDGATPVVARLDPPASARLLDESDERILAETLAPLAAALGARPDPAWIQVKRWRYAVVAGPLDPEAANPSGSRIAVCGDSVAGGGLAAVFASGVAAAERIMRA